MFLMINLNPLITNFLHNIKINNYRVDQIIIGIYLKIIPTYKTVLVL